MQRSYPSPEIGSSINKDFNQRRDNFTQKLLSLYALILLCVLASAIIRIALIQVELTRATVTAPSADASTVSSKLRNAHLSVIASPTASAVTAKIGETRLSGLARIELELNTLFAKRASLEHSVLFIIALLALYWVHASSSSATELTLAILYVGSPLALIAVASRICPHCAPDGIDWLALPISVTTVLLSGGLLTGAFALRKMPVTLLFASALVMLVGQAAISVAVPKFCPICLYLGALLQAVLFTSSNALATGAIRGVKFASPRLACTVLGIGLFASTFAWMHSPGPRLQKDISMKDVRMALSTYIRNGYGEDRVLMLTQNGCNACEEAREYIHESKIAIQEVPEATSSQPTGWNPSAHVVTPTFILIRKGEPSDFFVGFPTHDEDRRQLFQMVSASSGSPR